MKPTSIDSGITAATISAARTSRRNTNSTSDDEQRPFDQVLPHRVRRAVDDLGLVVERHDRSPPAASATISAIRAFTRSPTSLPFSPLSMMTMPATRLALAVARHGALARHGADAHLGHVARRRPATPSTVVDDDPLEVRRRR